MEMRQAVGRASFAGEDQEFSFDMSVSYPNGEPK